MINSSSLINYTLYFITKEIKLVRFSLSGLALTPIRFRFGSNLFFGSKKKDFQLDGLTPARFRVYEKIWIAKKKGCQLGGLMPVK